MEDDSECVIVKIKGAVGDPKSNGDCYIKLNGYGSNYQVIDNIDLEEIMGYFRTPLDKSVHVEINQPISFCQDNIMQRISYEYGAHTINPYYKPNSILDKGFDFIQNYTRSATYDSCIVTPGDNKMKLSLDKELFQVPVSFLTQFWSKLTYYEVFTPEKKILYRRYYY